jgi:hypothetical protein
MQINTNSGTIYTSQNTKKEEFPKSHISDKPHNKEMPSYSDGKHSFLFWLVIPIIIIWLTVGYILGLIKDKPFWEFAQNIYSQSPDTSQVKPVAIKYPPIIFDGNYPLVTIWFDDAWLSQYMVAYPILKKYNYPGTIAVTTDAIENTSYANWAQLRILQENGWEITNHSKIHDCNMQGWDSGKIRNELKESRNELWKNGLSSDIFVSPCGVDSQILRDEVAKEFIGFRTVDPGYNIANKVNHFNLMLRNIDHATPQEEIKGWIDYAKNNNFWVILVFHKVGEVANSKKDGEFNMPKENFMSIIDYIKEQNIRVVVPSQIISQGNI